jgi:hypothetical protein
MTDDPRSQLADLLSSELDAAQLRWVRVITDFERFTNSKGMFQSSARMTGTAERLNEGLIQYRQYIFDKWTAYVRPRLPSLSPAEQTAFVDVALTAMDNAIAMALRTLQSRAKPALQISTDFSGPIKDTAARERRSLETELRLYMSTPTDTPASMNVNVTTHGSGSPVNVVGSGTLNQQIKTAEGMAELVTVLGALLEAMKGHPQLGEVRDIVIEAKDEAAKPTPNRLKLRSILAGVSDGLQGIAAIQPAWEAVHRVAQMVGLAV